LSTYVYIPGHKSGENQSVTISLQSVSKELVEKLVKDKHPSLLDEAAYDLLELNTASTTAGRDTEMPGLIRKNEERYRKFVTFQLILGNYYFRKKDYKKSREFYEKALEIEPGNKDAKQMVKLLESSRR
jgi:tetratricopeptide (TPR) repeat protein